MTTIETILRELERVARRPGDWFEIDSDEARILWEYIERRPR